MNKQSLNGYLCLFLTLFTPAVILLLKGFQDRRKMSVNGKVVIERDNDFLGAHRSFYNGEEIIQPRQRWTREEQLELLDTHPMFTGRCPQCELPFPRYERPLVHWDCSQCGWVDDTL